MHRNRASLKYQVNRNGEAALLYALETITAMGQLVTNSIINKRDRFHGRFFHNTQNQYNSRKISLNFFTLTPTCCLNNRLKLLVTKAESQFTI